MMQQARSAIGGFFQYVSAKRGGLYVDRNHDYKRSVLIAGSGRSGTTWLAEIINSRNEFRDIFEPFFPTRMKICNHFANRQYLRPTDADPAYLEPARLIMSGQIRSDWTDSYNRRLICDRRLIKDIRVNLILKWLRCHFPEMPIVFILRHPCAVVNSRLQKHWNAEPKELFLQDALVEDHLKPFMQVIEGARSPFERHLVLWCIENYVPLRQLCEGEATVVFYEDLCTQLDIEISRLSGYLCMDLTQISIRRANKPSSQVRKRESAVALGQNVLTSWAKHVTSDQVKYACDTLDCFGLSRLYDCEKFAPIAKADQVLQH